MRTYFLLLACTLSWSTYAGAAEPVYAELMPMDTSPEACAAKIASNMIAAGQFADVRPTGFQCKPFFMTPNRKDCQFTATDQTVPSHAYTGNIEIERRLRIQEDPRTGERTNAIYCRIATTCWFTASWPFQLRNVNGTVIQHERACVLNSDLITDIQ